MQLRETYRRTRSIVLPGGFGGSRGVWTTVAVLAGLQLLLGLLVATSVTAELDAATLLWFRQFDRPGVAHTVIRIVLLSGQFALVWLTVLVVGALASWKLGTWRPFLVGGTTMILLDALILPYKFLLGRSAPRSGLNEVFVGKESYPSGHAAHATIAMLLLAALAGRVRSPDPARQWWGMWRWTVVVAMTVAVGAGVVNIMLQYHWLTDVLGGWALGLMMFVIANWLQRQDLPAGGPAEPVRTGMQRPSSSAR